MMKTEDRFEWSERARRAAALVGVAALVASAACNAGSPGGRDTRPEPAPSAPAPSTATKNAATDSAAAPPAEGAGGERYAAVEENPYSAVAQAPLSTFSVDVDTASYSNTRRFLDEGQIPPADAVRVEELVNYFSYDYPEPTGADPISVTAEVSQCPWNAQHRLVHVGLRAKTIPRRETPPRNLVFLVDTSGSMMDANKLPLVKSALKMLAGQLTARDRVSIVAYAGSAGLVLEPTEGTDRAAIEAAVDRLEAGGSTAGGAGIELAYATARRFYAPGGVNRVVLATDGDFNVGVASDAELVKLVERERDGGVFLTVLGVGGGNLNDSMMEKIADKGNGNYAYLDSLDEARKVLVDGIGGTLVAVAKDVKVQVEFNPREASAYRLVGYEDRMLANRDFDDDRKDAGDVGSGHTVTALYEVVPAGAKIATPGIDELKYQEPTNATVAAASGELMTIKVRYKQPDGDASKLMETAVADSGRSIRSASANLRFSAAVASFGMLLRGSRFKGSSTYADVIDLASGAKGEDADGRRREFLALAERASSLSRSGPADGPTGRRE